jgi:hypothetical protein
MEPLVVVYDACVLYPAFLRDFLVRLAIAGRQHGGLRAKWTGRIHREWMRAVRRQRPGVLWTNLQRTRRLMDRHVPGCRVRGYRRWERRLALPDPDDRHVLAAALACVADFIVTFNIADFPPAILAPFSVAAIEPDGLTVAVWNSGIVVAAAAAHRASLSRPALSPDEYLDALRRNNLPATATALAANHAGQF